MLEPVLTATNHTSNKSCRKYWSRLQLAVSEQLELWAKWTAPIVQFTKTMVHWVINLAMTLTAVLRSITTWNWPCEQECTCATIRSTRNASDEPLLCKQQHYWSDHKLSHASCFAVGQQNIHQNVPRTNDTLTFYLKVINCLHYHGNRGQSGTTLNVIIKLADPEIPQSGKRIWDISPI